ncbi:hypothetical protein GGI02_000998 [Coemansia sp. RSA 2322]|uniref:Probable RNA polymerase II nuclear localization protein SLC7A6OS n=1 Tax=Coemansia thaxteri TaxID=2663907 RepID=A0A9W8BA52_9FUNG|nr:hypothetical protein H4R26_004909 [Coemansia thaxteri]KAJ2473233.1 hypothetical protein GGI02_000998 [Coemansia sp. RSA 2322]
MQRGAGTESPNVITILRVKRKRGQEPLEALIIHQQKKKWTKEHSASSTPQTPSEAPQLFALGETISESDFGDEAIRQALQDRLTRLSKHRDDDMEVEVTGTSPSGLKKIAQVLAPPPQAKFRVVAAKQQVKLTSSAGGGRRVGGIPQVLAAADLGRDRCSIKMFDAINEEEYAPQPQQQQRQPHGVRDPYAQVALGSAVDELVPMVRNHLSLEKVDPEYVYDFYYARQQAQGNALNAPTVGSVTWIDELDDLLADAEATDEDDEDSNAEDYYANDYPDDESGSEMDDYYYSEEELEAREDRDDAVDVGNMDGGMYQGDEYDYE